MSRIQYVRRIRLLVLFAVVTFPFGGSVADADDPLDGPAPAQIPAKASRQVEVPAQAPQANQAKKEVVPKAADPKAADPKAADPKPDLEPAQPERKPESGEVKKAGAGQPAAKGVAVPAWLKKFVKNLVPAAGPNRPAMIPKNIGNTIVDDSSAKKDRFDSRAPQNTAQQKILRQAIRLIEAHEWEEALKYLQHLLKQDEDSLIRKANGRWGSIRAEANRLLNTLPAEYVDAYRLQNGGTAKQLLRDAQATGDLSKFTEVAGKFLQTDAGHEAANHLGTIHFDRGEFGMAARWFEQLLRVDAPVTKSPKWQMKAVIAFRQSGHAESGERLAERLASVGNRGVDFGGETVDPTKWLDEFAKISQVQPLALKDWPMFFGTPGRSGRISGGEPLLLKRWQIPLTQRPAIQNTITTLIDDLDDLNRSALPAFFPLMIDGKIIFRTLRGVQVVDAQTGSPLWETAEGVSAERILYRDSQKYVNGQLEWTNGTAAGIQYAGMSADTHPLAGLLFRDGLYGVLGSDGRQLFAIEDHAILSQYQPGYTSRVDPSRNDQYRRSWATNKLASYDLNTGSPRWVIGGKAMNEIFDLPLAGHFFFGTPVADGGDLFVTAERDNEIRLVALDPNNGHSRWSQLIAYSDAKIESDFGRRWWTSQIAVDNGVVVCPTTVGWLVAVDRTNRSVLWAHRYSRKPDQVVTRSARNNGGTQVRATKLNERWTPSAPVIIGNRVVYAAPESDALVCLDLFDGTRLWKKPKGTNLYLAGVVDDRVIVVGSQAVTCLSLENGTTTWSAEIPPSAGRPSGHSVIADRRLHVPLRSGQLWTFDIEDGSVITKSSVPNGAPALGNLAMYQGMVLSLSPSGLTSFEQREAIEATIRQRKQKDPRDSWATLREAEIHVVKQRHVEALGLLRQMSPEQLDDAQKPRFHQAMLASLTAVVRSDFKAGDRELQDLGRMVVSPSEKLRLDRLQADRLVARKEYQQAFEFFASLAEQDERQFVTRQSDPLVSVRFQNWLAGKLRDLWTQLPAADRPSIDAWIKTAAAESLKQSADRQRRFVTLFQFHPATIEVERRLIETLVQNGDVADAQSRLLRLAGSRDRTVAASALEWLARLTRQSGLPDDAGQLYRQLAVQFADVPIAGDKTAASLVDELLRDGTIGAGEVRPRQSWKDKDLKVVRIGKTSYSSSRRVESTLIADSRRPFYKDHIFYRMQQNRYSQQNQWLGIFNSSDGTLYWSVALRSKNGTYTSASLLPAEHLLFAVNGHFIHCLSVGEKKELWSHKLEMPTSGSTSRYRHTGYGYPSQGQTVHAHNLVTSSNLLVRDRLAVRAAKLGVIANTNYVCSRGRRDCTVLDATTGRLRWTRNRLPRGAQVFGTDDIIYLMAESGGQATALRASDGRTLPVPNLTTLLAQCVYATGNDLVLVQPPAKSPILGLGRGDLTIQRFNPQHNTSVWKISLPGSSLLSMLGKDTLCVQQPAGQLQLIDLNTGQIQNLDAGSKPLPKAKSIHAVQDPLNVYIFLNQAAASNPSATNPWLNIDGTVVAFNRVSGNQIWQQQVAKQKLPLENFAHLPVVLFANRTNHVESGLRYQKTAIVAIEKQTGRKLIETTMATRPYDKINGLDLNLAENYVELRSTYEYTRLFATPRKPAEKPAAKK